MLTMADLPSSKTVELNDGPHIYKDIGDMIEQKLQNVCQDIHDIKRALANITPPKHGHSNSANIQEHGSQASLSKSHNPRSHCEACSEIPQTIGPRVMSKEHTEWHCSQERKYKCVDKLKSKENSSVIAKIRKHCSHVFGPSRFKSHNDISKGCVNANSAEKKTTYDEVLIDENDEIWHCSPAYSQGSPYSETIDTWKIKFPPNTQEQDASTIEKKLENSIFYHGTAKNCQNINTGYEHVIGQQNKGRELKRQQNESSISETFRFNADTIKHGVISLPNRKKQNLKLVVFGCSGYGKSSIVNSMLGFRCINTSSEMIKTTQKPVLISTIVDEVKLKLVDTPGIEETKSLSHIETITKSLNLVHNSFSGLLLVLKYGERFTQQAKSIVKSLKGILGEKVIEDSCVCIMTHGEQFDDWMKRVDEPLSFDQWCRQQEHDIGLLFQECQYRCVLFENKTSDESKRKDQFDKLISMVNKLKMYRNSNFESCSKQREMFWLNCSLPQITEDAETRITALRAELQAIETNELKTENLSNLNLLLKRIEELKRSVPVHAEMIHSSILVFKSEVETKLKGLAFK